MSFPTPNADSSTANPNAETETETTTFGGDRHEQYETYWNVVDAYRAVRKLAVTYLFDSPEGVSNKEILAFTDESPLARDFDFYRAAKADIKSTLKEMRADDQLPEGASLPKYRAEFETPEAEHEALTVDNAEDWGVNPDTFKDDEDAMFVPTAYEPETDAEGSLIVWWSTDAAEKDFTSEEVLEIAAETAGVGDKTLAALKTNLDAAL